MDLFLLGKRDPALSNEVSKYRAEAMKMEWSPIVILVSRRYDGGESGARSEIESARCLTPGDFRGSAMKMYQGSCSC